MNNRDANQIKLLELSVLLAELILKTEGIKVGESTLFAGFYRTVREIEGEKEKKSNVFAKDNGLLETVIHGDCQKSANWGRSNDAKSFQNQQRELVGKNNFIDALKMDVDDVISKFADKYNDAIKNIISTVERMQQENVIDIDEAKSKSREVTATEGNKNNFNLANKLRNQSPSVANLSEIPSEKSDSVNRNLANQVKDHLAKDFEKLGEIKDRLADKLKPKARENNNL